MAINPETQYPGKIAPSTPAYPYGGARNVTAPGSGDGTPWEAAFVNDLFGFLQSLLDQAGIAPSGNPDEVGDSQYLASLRAAISNRSLSIFSTAANLASGTSVDGSQVAFKLGQAVAVVGENDTAEFYEVVNSAADIDLGGGLWAKRQKTRETDRVDSINANRVLADQSQIAALDDATILALATSKEGKAWEVSGSVNGLENTPDTIKMADGRYANRIGGFKPQRLGAFVTSALLGHRVGQLQYQKFSQTHAVLLTDLSKYMPFTLGDVDDPNVTKAYVDGENGDDLNGGTSWADAKQSIDAGISLNADITLVRAGFYNRALRMQDWNVTKDRAILAVGGTVYAGVLATGTWTKTGGQTNVYQLDYTPGLTNQTVGVFDTAQLDTELQPTNYASRGSVAAVDAEAGTYYHSGTTTYVHAVDSRDLVIHGDELRLTQPVATPTITWEGNFKVYIDGIEHWGGTGGCTTFVSDGSAYPGATMYWANGEFSAVRDGNQNGVQVRDIGICIFDRCLTRGNRRDGFNYHNYLAGAVGVDGQAPHAIEIDCQAHGNGDGGSEGNNQGSTAHENCVVFRIGGDYSGHADGGCIVDIEGVKAYNVCCTTKDSAVAGQLLSADGWLGENAIWWVDGGHFSGNPAVANARGDLAIDGFFSVLHMQDTDSEKPVSTRTFSQTPDEDFS